MQPDLTSGERIIVCHGCSLRAGDVCGVSGIDIAVHAKRDDCPHPDGSRFPGGAMHEADPSPALGPGAIMERLIALLGLPAGTSCGCDAFRAQMDEWGWWGCYRHRAEIVEWFVAKGKEAGVDIDRATVGGLLRAAFREYRRARLSVNR